MSGEQRVFSMTLTLPSLCDGSLPLPLRGRGAKGIRVEPLSRLGGRGRGPARQGREGEGLNQNPRIFAPPVL